MALYETGPQRVEIGGPDFDAPLAMQAMDEIITNIYLPFRGAEGYGTERAILVAPPHIHHRENDAEHSWSIAFTSLVYYDMRQELGLELPNDFNIDTAVSMAVIHDLPEIHARDVDAMTQNGNLIFLKAAREQAAFAHFMETYPNLHEVMGRWKKYDRKDTPEAQFISDLDKVFATRTIFLDGGKKWHGWEGYKTAREDMSNRMRGKLITDMGHKLFDILDDDIDNNPNVFPYHEAQGTYYQLAFDTDSLT